MDIIRNVVIREKVGVIPIVEKMRETKIKWFGHVKRGSENAPVSMCKKISLSVCRKVENDQRKVKMR